MKAFLLWCLLVVGLYTGFGMAYHVYLDRHPRKILIAIDTSYPMRTVWAHVPAVVQALQQQRYSRFSLITDKTRLHSWQRVPHLGNLQPYAPRDLSKLLDRRHYPEIDDADRIYVVTNAPDTLGLREAIGRDITVLSPGGA